jgi:hypothetical protein
LPPRTTSLLLVHAPARTEQVVELLGRAGAAAVEIVPPSQPPDLPVVAHLPTDAGIAEATG